MLPFDGDEFKDREDFVEFEDVESDRTMMDSYSLSHPTRFDRMEDLLESARIYGTADIYDDDFQGAETNYAETVRYLTAIKAALDGTLNQVHTKYRVMKSV